MKTFKVGDRRIWFLTYTPDGKSLVIQEGEAEQPERDHLEPVRVVRWWDWHRGKEEYAWQVVRPAVFSPDHRLVVTSIDSSEDGRWRWTLHDGRTLRCLQEGFRGTDFAFSRDNRVLVQIARFDDESPETEYFDVPKRYHAKATPRPENASTIAFSPDGKTYAAGGDSQEIVLTPLSVRNFPNAPEDGDWDRHMKEYHDQYTWLPGEDAGWTRRLLYVDENTLVMMSWPVGWTKKLPKSGRGRASLWDIPSKKCTGKVPGHTDRITDVALSADRQLVLTGGLDGTVRLWDPRDWKQLKSYTWDVGRVGAVAFAPAV
jgi:WD40 repeat protein